MPKLIQFLIAVGLIPPGVVLVAIGGVVFLDADSSKVSLDGFSAIRESIMVGALALFGLFVLAVSTYLLIKASKKI